MIVKVQRPISGVPEVLIYDRTRSQVYLTFPMTDEWDAIFKEHGLEKYGRFKFFAEVDLESREIRLAQFFKADLGW